MREPDRPQPRDVPVFGAKAAVATLDEFLSAVARLSGVAIGDLATGVHVQVRTQNSTYRLEVCDPARRSVLALGGRFLGAPAAVRVSGSTFGGSLLKEGWIGLGMRLELERGGTTILTSRIRQIVVENPPSNRIVGSCHVH